jgi:hypothetical protein
MITTYQVNTQTKDGIEWYFGIAKAFTTLELAQQFVNYHQLENSLYRAKLLQIDAEIDRHKAEFEEDERNEYYLSELCFKYCDLTSNEPEYFCDEFVIKELIIYDKF